MAKEKVPTTQSPPESKAVEMFNLKKHQNWLSGGTDSKVSPPRKIRNGKG